MFGITNVLFLYATRKKTAEGKCKEESVMQKLGFCCILQFMKRKADKLVQHNLTDHGALLILPNECKLVKHTVFRRLRPQAFQQGTEEPKNLG